MPSPALARAAVRRAAPDGTGQGPTSGEDARALYEAGERNYRRGRFREALEKFELAYDLSEQPLLLYNIALAYRQLYDVAADVEELRRGRAVLKNFMLFADRDPDLDATDARKLLVEIEQLIADHKDKPVTVVAGPGPDPGPDDGPKTPQGQDPGRTLRIAGGATMGAGGVFLVGGTVAGIVNLVKGREFSDTLKREQGIQTTECPADANAPASTACLQARANAETARDNGNKANLGAGLSFGIGGGLGAVALAAGVVLFLQGNKRSKEWKAGNAARLPRIGPSVARDGIGVSISGRF